MTTDPISHLAELRAKGFPCALITVVATTGSTPRKPGAKMVVTPSDPSLVGTIGGGKLEALAVEMAQRLLAEGRSDPHLQTYPLHEADGQSFGAICGGEAIILTESFPALRTLVVVGAGHCGSAIASIALQTGFSVTVVDDRPDLLQKISGGSISTLADLGNLPFLSAATSAHHPSSPLGFIAVSRNFEIDLGALRKILPFAESIPYLGMIGSKKKVRRVFETLAAEGVDQTVLTRIFAPIGLDIGAESPEEIAVSVVAQILAVTRGKMGGHLALSTAPSLST